MVRTVWRLRAGSSLFGISAQGKVTSCSQRSLCLSKSQNPCPTAVYITLLHSSLQKKKVHVDVCDVTVHVGVFVCCYCACVVVVGVVIVSAMVVLCVFCGCCVSVVMCPSLCVQCDCLAIDRTNFVIFHLLTLVGSQETYDLLNFLDIENNYAKLSDEAAGPKKPQIDIGKHPIDRNTM